MQANLQVKPNGARRRRQQRFNAQLNTQWKETIIRFSHDRTAISACIIDETRSRPTRMLFRWWMTIKPRLWRSRCLNYRPILSIRSSSLLLLLLLLCIGSFLFLLIWWRRVSCTDAAPRQALHAPLAAIFLTYRALQVWCKAMCGFCASQRPDTLVTNMLGTVV